MTRKRAASVLVVLLVGMGITGITAHRWWHPRDHLAAAAAASARGDLRAARLDLRGAVVEWPGNGEAHFRLGALDLRVGNPSAAERELLAARSLGWPTSAVSPLLARDRLAQGRFTDVLQDLEADGLPPEGGAICRFLYVHDERLVGSRDPF